jgi:xylan 1,4-beta-xylosidase
MIHNPVLPGFNPDPCICRKGSDFYMAVSSFEWFPGVPVYHSKDLKHWELYANALTDPHSVDLRGLPSAKGIWAPCLTYCREDDLFYLVYGIMHSMNARYFDISNYLITARDPAGPWSEPVYLHSMGFDASLFHDDDGRKYLAALEWETREGHEKPGPISIMEYDPVLKKVIGFPRRIWRGATDRGCIEAPHLTKRNGFYYIMCAEGGTGYYHSVTMGRSRNVFGPYEPDPMGPILTSSPGDFNERSDWDHLKPRYYNPEVTLQKAGHGSYVDLPGGETYLLFHCSRPFTPELRCTLGRETAIARMRWTKDGWLRTESGSPLPDEWVRESALPETDLQGPPAFDDFDSDTLGLMYYAPRIDPKSFTDLTSRPGWIRLKGQESGASLHQVSILARKLTSLHAAATVKMEFDPVCWQHSAGLILYYDNMNFFYLGKTFSEELGQPMLQLLRLENGIRYEYPDHIVPLREQGPVWLRFTVEGRDTRFYYSFDGETYFPVGPSLDTSLLSDEYSDYGEFTGTFAGITCADRLLHEKSADFDFFELKNT